MAFDLDDEENEATRVANGASKESRGKNMDIEVGEYVNGKYVKEIKTVKVDGKNIKEDTYYALENGEFVEKGSASDDND